MIGTGAATFGNFRFHFLTGCFVAVMGRTKREHKCFGSHRSTVTIEYPANQKSNSASGYLAAWPGGYSLFSCVATCLRGCLAT